MVLPGVLLRCRADRAQLLGGERVADVGRQDAQELFGSDFAHQHAGLIPGLAREPAGALAPLRFSGYDRTSSRLPVKNGFSAARDLPRDPCLSQCGTVFILSETLVNVL